MAFFTVKWANGKTRTFASERAVRNAIADMLRAQRRLIDGTTLKEKVPTDQHARHTRTAAMWPNDRTPKGR